MIMNLHAACKNLIDAYKTGKLGQTTMPEDTNPGFSDNESEMRIAYFTLPMALNYQRDSYKLWEAALKTYQDPETTFVFDIKKVTDADEDAVRNALMKYKLALQPNKHINTWRTISKTVFENWKTWSTLFTSADNDFLKLKKILTIDHKKGFPYLSGPKILNYWSFIITTYGTVSLTNREYIEIAPDTHITQCSVKLGIITADEALSLTKDQISERWRQQLHGSGIDPIDMHSPLWFWSRNGFLYNLG
jgi:hypothetical protein